MEEKKVTWLELFYDLLFVSAVTTSTHVLLHVENGLVHPEYLFKFVLMFIPIWWSWTGQTMFTNRFGKDHINQQVFMVLQMFFVLILVSSLSVDFDQYYFSFLIGYIGIRAITAIQYLRVLKLENGHRKQVAMYLGTRFWIGIFISFLSLFFDSWMRYAVLYAGILVDIIVPILGRKYLVKAPINPAHLLERFALFTLILFGESVISIITILQPLSGSWHAIFFSIITFIFIILIWLHYFHNIERKVNKHAKRAGQTIIYGHLFILMSLSMIAASIKLMYVNEVSYSYMIYFVFGSVLIYYLSTSIVFHKCKNNRLDLKINHIVLLLVILIIIFIMNLILVVPPIGVMIELLLFFLIVHFYSKVSMIYEKLTNR
ncbi:low temperature requirement protein A [Gottfriedia solisilvae]|uniref:low temperature requirement protein A n=1 Tax=Gottfriedia solisilvae TaxID=1516104 RepID=UPI001151AFDF|nr:low temperature requirement protein A [Gottfriedia solisilvae]